MTKGKISCGYCDHYKPCYKRFHVDDLIQKTKEDIFNEIENMLQIGCISKHNNKLNHLKIKFQGLNKIKED